MLLLAAALKILAPSLKSFSRLNSLNLFQSKQSSCLHVKLGNLSEISKIHAFSADSLFSLYLVMVNLEGAFPSCVGVKLFVCCTF